MNVSENKLLTKWVSQYVDPTVPSEIIKETVEELEQLHKEGKFLFSESAVYDFVHQIKRDKNGLITEFEGMETAHEDEMTEPEEFEAIDCSIIEEILE